jgi:AcrR family transcriptional regulator
MGKSSRARARGRGRGRPTRSQQQIDDRRAHIAACALKLFQEEGYAAISMRRLAEEAGCTVMTLYQYYKRKIDILRDLWAQIFEELFDALDDVAARESNAVTRLNAVALGYVEFWLERRDRYFMVFMSSGVTQSDVSLFVRQDAVLSRFAIFRDCLAKALVGASASELTLKSQILLCALNGIAHNLITISAYPWSTPKKLVRGAVSGLLGT